MTLLFWLFITILICITLLALTVPLICNHKTKQSYLLLMLMIIFVPLASISLYLHWGAPSQLAAYYHQQANQKRIEKEIASFKSPQQVIAKMQHILEAHPDSVKGWYLLGRLYSSVGQYKDSVNAFSKALQLQPNNPVLMFQFVEASYFANHRRLDSTANKLLQQILLSQPSNAEAINLMALNFYELGNYRQAIFYWKKILLLFPENSEEAVAINKAIMNAVNKEK